MSDKIYKKCHYCTQHRCPGDDGIGSICHDDCSDCSARCMSCNGKGYIEVDPIDLGVVKELREKVDELEHALIWMCRVHEEQYTVMMDSLNLETVDEITDNMVLKTPRIQGVRNAVEISKISALYLDDTKAISGFYGVTKRRE